MTIASEITRLQNDKAAMCAAIENKGVTVGNVTFDDYASCIDAISQGSTDKTIDLLVVGGGGGGGYYGGGGGGGVVYKEKHIIDCPYYDVCIGSGGGYSYTGGGMGGNSYFGNIIGYGGGGGGGCCSGQGYGRSGGSGGGATFDYYRQSSAPVYTSGGHGCYGQGSDGGAALRYNTCASAGGGGGAGGSGGYVLCGSGNACGGSGLGVDISGNTEYYGAGGAGGHTDSAGTNSYCGGCGGGGNTASNGTGYGAGGGGAGGSGHCGIVIVRYHTDGSDNICCAVGGCKYECGDYTIHCFTGNGYFFPEPLTTCVFKYLVVGGGGSGGKITCRGGGGGGDVKYGIYSASSCTHTIVVGCGGARVTTNNTPGNPGGDSCLNEVVAKGGCGGQRDGGDSGSGCVGGAYRTTCGSGGGGAGAGGNGNAPSSNDYGGNGGLGLCGYGGGGGGASYRASACQYYRGQGCCGGGNGATGSSNSSANTGCPATTCGSGGGGGGSGGSGAGAAGVVDICYPTDGSFGFTVATGGDSCYTCNGYCVHRFTSNGTFTIVS